MTDFMYKYVDDETWCLTGYKGDETHIALPDLHGGKPITSINDDLFKGHAELESVTLPSVTLPNSLTDIWQYAFVRSGITEIEIPGSLNHVIPFVFKDCKCLTKVVIKPGVQKVFGRAFDGCSALREVHAPADTEISPEAFTGCDDVTVIRY